MYFWIAFRISTSFKILARMLYNEAKALSFKLIICYFLFFMYFKFISVPVSSLKTEYLDFLKIFRFVLFCIIVLCILVANIGIYYESFYSLGFSLIIFLVSDSVLILIEVEGIESLLNESKFDLFGFKLICLTIVMYY